MTENGFYVIYGHGLIAVAGCASKLSIFDASKNPSEIRDIRVHERVPDILTRQVVYFVGETTRSLGLPAR